MVTAGFPRKPGMTREELAAKNAGVVKAVAENIKRYAPDSVVIMTTNPLDAMLYVMYKQLGFPRERVIGFSGVLDSGRLRYYAAKRLGVAPAAITPVVLGMHGRAMYPVPRLSNIYGKSLTEFLSEEEISSVVEETIKAGATITNLRGYSSNYGPGAGLAMMVESVKKDLKKVFLASVYLKGEYGVSDITAGVPIVLGRSGVERIIELPLTEEERKGFLASVEAIRKNLQQVPEEYWKF